MFYQLLLSHSYYAKLVIQSDRQSKNYDEATKLFLSRVGVANRTRSKRGVTYYETTAEEAHGISSSSQNVEASGISAPIPQRKQNFRKTGSGEISAPHDCRRQQKRRRIESKPTQRVSPGNKDFEEIEIERIGVAESKNKKTCFASKMESSTRKKLDVGFSVASSRKNVDSTRKNVDSTRKNVDSMREKASPSLQRCFSLKNVGHGSDRGVFLQRVNNSGRVGKKRNQSMPMIGPSTRHVINDRFAASTSKNVCGVSKSMCCGSFSPENDGLHLNQGWRDQPSSTLQQASRRKIHCNEDRDVDGVDVELIEEVEFMNQKKHFMPKSGFSTKEKLNKGYVTTSWNVRKARKKTSCADCCERCYPTHACDSADELCLQESGSDSEDMVPEEPEIKEISGAKFEHEKTHFLRKTGPSKGQELTGGRFAASSSKNVDGTRKNTSYDDICISYSPEDSEATDTDPLLDMLSPLAKEGNNNEGTSSKEIAVERIDKAEFRRSILRSASKIGSSTKQEVDERYYATNSRKKAFAKEVASDMCYTSFSSKNAARDSYKGQTDKSISSAKKGNKNECTSSKELEIERIDEAEFRRSMLRSASKIRSSTKQEVDERYSATNSRKNAFAKEVAPDKRWGSFSSKNAGRDSYKGQTDKSILSAKKGKSNDNIHPEEYGIEEIDESEFKKKRTHLVSKRGSSATEELNGDFATTSRGNANSMKTPSAGNVDKNKKKTEVAACSRRTKSDEDWNTILDDNIDSNSSESISSYSTSYSISENTNGLLQDEEITSFSEGHKINLGVASRTRSKAGIIKKPSDDSDSPIDGGFCSSDDEDFESDSSFNSDDIELLDVKTYEIQKNILPDVSAEKSEDCRKQGHAVKHASKSGHLSDIQKKETNCKKPTSQRRQVSSRKRPWSPDVSSKQTKGEKAHTIYEVPEENEEINTSFGNDVNAEEGSGERRNEKRDNMLKKEMNCRKPTSQRRQVSSRKRPLSPDVSSKQTKGEKARIIYEVPEENEEINRTVGDDVNADESSGERRNEKRDNMPKFTYSKQLETHMDCDAAEEVNELRTKEPPQAVVGKQKNEASPPQSQDDCDHIHSDDIQENFDATTSDFHTHDKTEKVDVADEVTKPAETKQVSSKHYDFCTMLADSVLGTGPTLETKAIDEADKKAPASQTESTLPLRFRFEDEVPEEIEKTEFEIEMEGLFAELDFSLALQEMGSFCPEIGQENGNSPAEESYHARCTKGKHELILQDDLGLFCKYCHHVELGPKDVLPEWVEKSYRESERKRDLESAHLLNFDGIHLQSSINNSADVGSSSNGTVWSLKPGIRESMYEHQQEGFEFLWKNLGGSINLDELKSSDPGEVGGCIISHAPGTGKTRLTIVFMESYLKMFPNCHPMIIAPAGMLLTWEEEFRKWNIDFPFFNLNNPELLGNENKTAAGLLERGKRGNQEAIRWLKIYSWNNTRSILGISYSLFEKLTGEKHLKKLKAGEKRKSVAAATDPKLISQRQILLEKPGLVVLDEGHTPRNQRSNIWNVLLKLQTEKRVILSGTPFQNNFAELFNTLRLVRPAVADVLVHEKTFSEMVTPRRNHHHSTLNSEVVDRAVDKLKVYMSPFVHVHRGTILKQSLPGLMDSVILLKPPRLQKSLIERLEGSPSTFEFEHKVALISVHPYLFQHSDSTEEQTTGTDIAAVEASKLNPNEGVKTKFVLELVRLSMAMNEKVLIFSQYILPLDLIKEQLKEIFRWSDGKQILQMRGRLDQKQRQVLINLFNDSQSESKVMLASIRCCSEGISLVGASRVVLLDVVWNPSVERQAISRAYRIGQKKFVYTYHLMTSGTTEADKYCRQAEKDRLSELVFSSTNEGDKEEHPSLGIEDGILEEMVGHVNLKEMFEKIIYQPKDTDLIQTFGLTS